MYRHVHTHVHNTISSITHVYKKMKNVCVYVCVCMYVISMYGNTYVHNYVCIIIYMLMYTDNIWVIIYNYYN